MRGLMQSGKSKQYARRRRNGGPYSDGILRHLDIAEEKFLIRVGVTRGSSALFVEIEDTSSFVRAGRKQCEEM
jgi:hypothetical protein